MIHLIGMEEEIVTFSLFISYSEYYSLSVLPIQQAIGSLFKYYSDTKIHILFDYNSIGLFILQMM